MLLAALMVAAAGCAYIFPAKYALEEAMKLQAEGKYREAVAGFEAIARDHRDKPEAETALSLAAELYEEKLNDWQKAAALLQELRTVTEGTPRNPEVLLRLARILEQSGSPYRDALNMYKVICKDCATEPESIRALLAQGRIYESMQRWTDAKHSYEEAVARHGMACASGTVLARLQSVWLLEAMGKYHGGDVEEGVRLAGEALGKEIIAPEVKVGLEDLVRRYDVARTLWEAFPDDIFVTGGTITDAAALSEYIYAAERGKRQTPPPGWELNYSEKRQTFTLREAPVSGTSSTASGKKSGRKPWAFTPPDWTKVSGVWWSSDGRYVVWSGRSRKTNYREIRMLNVRTRKSWRVIKDQSGRLLGETVLCLPNAKKLVFPYGNYLVVSDLRGGNRVQLEVRSSTKPRARYRTDDVVWLACSADGLELAICVLQSSNKKEPPRHMYWKFNLSARKGRIG